MAKRKDTDYIFADAYIGTFTSHLMTEKDLMRVASSRDLEAAEMTLREFGYEESKELREGDIDAFLHREEAKLQEVVFSSIPDPGELAFNLYPADYHNAKVCLKADIMEKSPDPSILSDAGSVPTDVLVTSIRERNGNQLPEVLRLAIEEAIDVYGRGHDPQDIDFILDRACYKQMMDDVKMLNEPFLEELVRKQIDAVNASLFVRFRRMGKTWSDFRDRFIEGGNITLQLFVSAYEESFSRVGERLAFCGLQDVFTEGGREITENGNFGLFEKLRDDSVMKHVRDAKYVPFGIVPIEGYWFAKHQELANLRIVLTGNQFGFSTAEIEERIREPYV